MRNPVLTTTAIIMISGDCGRRRNRAMISTTAIRVQYCKNQSCNFLIIWSFQDRKNKDFLFQPGLPATFGAFGGGALTLPYENIGQISNKGVEMSLSWKDNFSRDWKYEVGFNATFNKNRIDKLAPEFGVTDFFPNIVESRIGPLVRDYEGAPMSTFYG